MRQSDNSDAGADAVEFGRRLREVRRARGLEQLWLAGKAGLQPSSVSNFELGKRKPSLGSLVRLADALMVSIDYLVGRSDNPLSHLGAETEGPAAHRLWSMEEINAVEEFLAHAKARAGHVADAPEPGDPSATKDGPE